MHSGLQGALVPCHVPTQPPGLLSSWTRWVAKWVTRNVSFCLENFPKGAFRQRRAWPTVPTLQTALGRTNTCREVTTERL